VNPSLLLTLVGALGLGGGTALLVHLVTGSHGNRTPKVRRAGATAGLGMARLGDRSRRDALGEVAGDDDSVRRLLRRQGITVTLATVAVGALVAGGPSLGTMLAGFAVIAGAWQFPLITARRAERERRAAVDRELTRALPELVMGVEAGLSLDAVMTRYANRHRSALADEFGRVTLSVNAGATRRDAVGEMAERTPTPIMRAFASAVEQNLVLGTPLATVLRTQAETVRRHRRQAAETRAASVSMKMIFPTVFCILPLLMVVVVGPAIVRLIEVL
jgi:tight adherence protein C